MKILRILPILTSLFCNWCCVASPQSNSQTSLLSRRASDEWFLVDDGWADAVPRKVIFIETRWVRLGNDVGAVLPGVRDFETVCNDNTIR